MSGISAKKINGDKIETRTSVFSQIISPRSVFVCAQVRAHICILNKIVFITIATTTYYMKDIDLYNVVKNTFVYTFNLYCN